MLDLDSGRFHLEDWRAHLQGCMHSVGPNDVWTSSWLARVTIGAPPDLFDNFHWILSVHPGHDGRFSIKIGGVTGKFC